MHLRISRTKRNGKTYEYAQLVESVRRAEDRMPAHRVVATLGALSERELANLRTALGASREGKHVVVAPYVRAQAAMPHVVASLRYLDVAVALELWREWGLSQMLAQVLPRGDAEVAPADVIAALVVQRLVEPGSKLAATEWFPRTALPELLDVAPARFNNTRIHRALETLEAHSSELMARLPPRYEEKEGAFASLFLDVSDAMFVGHGPSIAQRAKTKEGVVARKIGIVLLCNTRGYPLRWQVVPGAVHDSKTMLTMIDSVAGLRWLGQAPIVCDRAMGQTATLLALHRLDVRFLTALTKIEFASYSGDRVPFDAVAALRPSTSFDVKVESEAARLVAAADMQQVEDNLYVLDVGIVERVDEAIAPRTAVAPTAAPSQAMSHCQRMSELVASGECTSFEQARRRLGLHKSVATKYRGLHKLVDEVQRQVIEGRAEHCSLDALLRLARHSPTEQVGLFAQLVASQRRQRASASTALPRPADAVSTMRLRVVACFNPQRFVQKRHSAWDLLDEMRQFVADLNARLLASGSRRTRASVEAEIDRKLRAHDLLECFEVRVAEPSSDGARLSVELILDEQRWARRRRYDGFMLLVAHPSLPHSAAELARLYRAKDAVEKDFHIIKSVVEVAPVWHHTDDKVRAHVTLCMLALLLERTLAHRLRGVASAEAALERLEPCRLNRFDADDSAYGLTRATDEQKHILRRIDLLRLVDDARVAESIRPR